MTLTRTALAALLICAGATAAHAQKGKTLTVKQATARLASIASLVTTLDSLIADPLPKGATAQLSTEWENGRLWMQGLRDRYLTHSMELRKVIDAGADASQMAQMNMQFLALQEATQMESRKFADATAVLKTRHDTVKNSISNVR